MSTSRLPRRQRTALAVAALGVVYGDIGTSPLYAIEGSVRQRAPSGADRTGERAGHPVPGLLGADHHRLRQVRRGGASGRQQRRRRHHRADGAVAVAEASLGEARPRRAHARPDRSRALLRGWRHHSGHLGALRHRGPRGGDRRVQALGRAADRRRSRRAVPRAKAGHREGRRGVRPDHDAVVRHACRAGRVADRRPPAGALRTLARIRLRLPRHAPQARILRTRGGLPRRHRRRGAVRGHGAFRARAHPACVVRHRAAGARRELFRPGRAAARRSDGGEQSLLPSRSRMGAASRSWSSRRRPPSSRHRRSSPASTR